MPLTDCETHGFNVESACQRCLDQALIEELEMRRYVEWAADQDCICVRFEAMLNDECFSCRARNVLSNE